MILDSDVDHIAVRVEIVDDIDPEGLESFYGKLDISCESATFARVRISLATVIILDNDGRCLCMGVIHKSVMETFLGGEGINNKVLW